MVSETHYGSFDGRSILEDEIVLALLTNLIKSDDFFRLLSEIDYDMAWDWICFLRGRFFELRFDVLEFFCELRVLAYHLFLTKPKALATATAIFDLIACIYVDDFSIFFGTCDACSLEMIEGVRMHKESDRCDFTGSFDHFCEL